MSEEKHSGSCHCGAVRFEAVLDVGRATRCNCSICAKLAITGVNVKPEAFTLLAGEEALGGYSWATRTATRFFCARCGVHCFARGHLDMLGGDFVSINVNCLDDVDAASLKVMYWDGRHDNWGAGPRETPWPVFA